MKTPEQRKAWQINLIKQLETASDRQLDEAGRKLCEEFDPEKDDPVRFIRDLQDLSVRYGWVSGFVMTVFMIALDGEPEETEEEADARRAQLLKIYEPGTKEKQQ